MQKAIISFQNFSIEKKVKWRLSERKEFSGIPKVVVCLKGGASIHATVPRVSSVTPNGFNFSLTAPERAIGLKVALTYIAMYYPS